MMIYISGVHINKLQSGRERCAVLGTYIVEHSSTVRATAKKFGISKSTVHKDVTETLKHVNPSLYEEVRKILEQNKQERHIRGGEATRLKYRAERQKNNSAEE